ncbi:MAG: MotA/TolQ/ExbB proton channel family protein [Lachnospiraceae bacterium]|nr:MotA/TolQ/ExbB proton channel family protein [Lachnospiraceae bacterium]
MIVIDFLKNMSAFEWIFDGLILIWSVTIIKKLSEVKNHLFKIEKDTDKAYQSTKGEVSVDVEGNIDRPVSHKFNKRKHDPVRKEFSEQVVKYIKWAGFISTLPLAGLLGTVLGLIPGLMAVKDQNFDALYSSLSTALSSTVIGLVASLVLKIYASTGPDAQLNKVELLFDEIDRLYDEAISLENIKK